MLSAAGRRVKTVARTGRRLGLFAAAAALLAMGPAAAKAVERFPPPEFESGHVLPVMQQPLPRSAVMAAVDVGVLAVALGLAAYFLLGRRSRRALVVLSLVCLAYFGFYRMGCVCPIGAIQNVSVGLSLAGFILPISVVAFFLLPLVFSVFFGRVFCGAVCPLGAIQDVMLVKAARVPRWIDSAFRPVPFLYLGLAVLLAAAGSQGGGVPFFLICAYDPFVGFFRLSGPFLMLAAGGVVLVLSLFVARPYCRFLCPYGALLGLTSRVAWKGVRITPDECVVCRLCEEACPLGAITGPDAAEGRS